MTDDEKIWLRGLLESGDKDAWGIYGSVIRKRRTAANAEASRENGKKGGRPPGSKDSKPRTRKSSKENSQGGNSMHLREELGHAVAANVAADGSAEVPVAAICECLNRKPDYAARWPEIFRAALAYFAADYGLTYEWDGNPAPDHHITFLPKDH